jgi:SAM-dependent methyltransferase
MRVRYVVEGLGLSEDGKLEEWQGLYRGHWYEAGLRFAEHHLKGVEGSCLVVGSPLEEVRVLRGWLDVTYLDIRKPPDAFGKHVVADCMKIPFEDETFDCLSSTCVLTHVGTGRYGDGMDEEYGDEVALKEMARVLKKGGVGAIQFGPFIESPVMIQCSLVHRVYSLGEVARMCEVAGLKIFEVGIWDYRTRHWNSEKIENPNIPQKIEFQVGETDYISVAVRK